MPKNFFARLRLKAAPADVYAALTNPFAIELWTGYPAKMQDQPDSEFELWEGDICGRNIRFIPDQLVEQQWYFGDDAPVSIVTFKIMPRGAEGSTLEVTHTNIPDADYDDLTAGWHESYLEPLRIFLEEE